MSFFALLPLNPKCRHSLDSEWDSFFTFVELAENALHCHLCGPLAYTNMNYVHSHTPWKRCAKDLMNTTVHAYAKTFTYVHNKPVSMIRDSPTWRPQSWRRCRRCSATISDPGQYHSGAGQPGVYISICHTAIQKQRSSRPRLLCVPCSEGGNILFVQEVATRLIW